MQNAGARGRSVGIKTQVLGARDQVLASGFGDMDLKLYGQVSKLCPQKLWRSDLYFWRETPKPGIKLSQLEDKVIP